MKRFLTVVLPVTALVLVAGVAFAQMGGGMMGGRGGMMGGMGGMMGGGMMGGGPSGAPGDCHDAVAAQGQQPQLTEEKAREIAQRYASQYLPGFYVDKLQALTGMQMPMYSAELRGPKDGEVRILHINPWGQVMVHGPSAPQG